MFGNIILDISYFIIQMLLDFALVCFGYYVGKKSLKWKLENLERQNDILTNQLKDAYSKKEP